MPRPLSIALIATICLGVTARAEDKPSPAVKRVLDKAVAEVKKNRQEFDKANTKPLGEAKKALEDQAKKLIEDGKTDEATAILGQVKTLEADVMKMANAPASVPVPAGGGGPVPQKPLLERLEGKWTHPAWVMVASIQRDGMYQETFKNKEKTNATGKAVVIAENLAEIKLSQGWRCRVSLVSNDLLAVQMWNDRDQPVQGMVLERIK